MHEFTATVVVAPVGVNGITVAHEMAMKGARVVGVFHDGDAFALKSRFVHERCIIPHPRESPGSLAEFLLSRKDLHGAIVIPTEDMSLRDIESQHSALAPLYRLAVPPPEAAHTALDKGLTYDAARDIGITVPQTFPLSGPSDLSPALDVTGLPALMRPAFSAAFAREFGVKSFRPSTHEEAVALFDKAQASGHKMLLQEIIPGPDQNVVSVKAYVTDKGEVYGPTCGFKLAIYPPSFGVSQMQETRSCPELEEGSRRILARIGFRGSLTSVEWKLDPRDGKWKLLEVNARSVLAIKLPKFSGCDILEALWRDKMGLPALPPPRIKCGRRWAYLKNALLLLRGGRGEGKYFWRYIRFYRPPICFAVFYWNDPMPFLRDMAPVFKRRFGKR